MIVVRTARDCVEVGGMPARCALMAYGWPDLPEMNETTPAAGHPRAERRPHPWNRRQP